MPLKIIRQDITALKVDAIVNATDPWLSGSGGVDAAIHQAAAPMMAEACRIVENCPPGEARLTPGYQLPCKYVIHTVGPIWQNGESGEHELLRLCYQRCLAMAEAQGCRSIAFPLIAAGTFGFPRELALHIARETIGDYLNTHEMNVLLVVYDRESFRISQTLFEHVTQYIDDHYISEKRSARFFPEHPLYFTRSAHREAVPYADAEELPSAPKLTSATQPFSLSSASTYAGSAACPGASPDSLEDILSQLDESFSQMVLRKIDEKGITDASCYKRANLDRKLFSKLRSNKHYKPSKRTALALAVALELSLDDTRDLLRKAGFALSRSSKADVIVEYFIVHRNFNIREINETLFCFDQQLLGG